MSSYLCIYFDENVNQRLLKPLRKAGLTVYIPKDFGMLGEKDDTLQLAMAIELNCVFITADKGFRHINERWLKEGKHHTGIVLIRSEQNHLESNLVEKLILICTTKRPEDMYDLFWLI